MKELLIYTVLVFEINCQQCEPLAIVPFGFDGMPMTEYAQCEFMRRAAQSYWAIYRGQVVDVTCSPVGKLKFEAKD